MATRLLKASSYYPGYIRWFYDRHPRLLEASYAEQHAALMGDFFSLSDSWKRRLESDGRFAVEELVVNVEPMQKRWALENGASYGESTWLRDIFMAQYERFSPRVLFAHSDFVAIGVKDGLKASRGSGLAVVCHDGTARSDPRLARCCDLMLTCDESVIPAYEGWGVRTHYMPWGFDGDVLTRLGKFGESPGVSFVGAIGTEHQERAKLLSELAGRLPVDTWLSDLPDRRRLARSAAWHLLRGDWRWLAGIPRLGARVARLRAINRGELFGIEMLSALAASRVTLNVHLSVKGTTAGNIRLFEATGVGACLVTDWQPKLDRMFEVDREVVAFRSVDEAEEKTRYLLDHEGTRMEIARRGQARTLASHRYGDRIEEVGDLILGLL